MNNKELKGYEIEFRGKVDFDYDVNCSNRWAYGYIIPSLSGRFFYILEKDGKKTKVDKETIGQYTNGKLNDQKIYQGDLIKVNEHFDCDDFMPEAIYEVVREEFEFFCKNENDSYLSLFDVIYNHGGEIVEVKYFNTKKEK